MELGDAFISLRKFAKGKIGKQELYESDPLISKVREESNERVKSEVYLEFENSGELLRILGLNDDDIWFYNAVNSYDSYELYDHHSASEDFENGYGLWYYLDDENIETLEKISKFIYSEPFDLENSKFKEGLAKKLIELFPRDMSDIFWDYTTERNSEITYSARESIREEISDFFGNIEFELIGEDILKTSVGELISLYIEEGIPHENLKNLFESYFSRQGGMRGGWRDSEWEYSTDENFDKDSFNRTVKRNLDDMLEKLMESFGDEEGRKFLDFVEKITKKFKVGKFYELPKDRRYKFAVTDFDRDNKKIVLSLKKPDGDSKKIPLSQENFYNLLYQPELFKIDELY